MDLEAVVSHAEDMGLRIRWADLGSRSGELRASGIVVINPRKSILTQRITVAHECGHAHFGHDWRHRHDRERDEREADLYAARLLIDASAVESAAILYDGDPRAIARELGLPVALLRLWAQSRAPINEL